MCHARDRMKAVHVLTGYPGSTIKIGSFYDGRKHGFDDLKRVEDERYHWQGISYLVTRIRREHGWALTTIWIMDSQPAIYQTRVKLVSLGALIVGREMNDHPPQVVGIGRPT